MKMWKMLCYDIKNGCIKNLKLLLFPIIFETVVQTGYPAKLWIIVLMSMLMAVITIVVNVVLMHKKDVM